VTSGHPGSATAIGGMEASRSDPGAVAAHNLFTREARRDGRLVVELRCARRGEGFVVECDTYSVSAPDSSPQRRAFAFRDRPSAERFVSETLRALQYLGCRTD
jgi:hypothetical protein